MDDSLAQQLNTGWEAGFSKELASNDLNEVKWGIRRAVEILDKQDTTIGRLKLTLGASIIAIVCLWGYIASRSSDKESLNKAGGISQNASPIAQWIPWKEWQMVFSPFTQDGFVDVEGMTPGTEVLCPMTGKKFTIPAMPKTIPDHADAFLKRYQQ